MKKTAKEFNGYFYCIERNKKILQSINKIKSFHIFLVKVIRLTCGKLFFSLSRFHGIHRIIERIQCAGIPE